MKLWRRDVLWKQGAGGKELEAACGSVDRVNKCRVRRCNAATSIHFTSESMGFYQLGRVSFYHAASRAIVFLTLETKPGKT